MGVRRGEASGDARPVEHRARRLGTGLDSLTGLWYNARRSREQGSSFTTLHSTLRRGPGLVAEDGSLQ